MALTYACIAPHGGELIQQLAPQPMVARFAKTREALRQIAASVAANRPDSIIIASPHNLRLLGRIGVILSENSSGRLQGPGNRSVSLKAKCNVDFANELLERAVDRGLPVVGANYGTSEGPASDMPMDWGTLVPFGFSSKRCASKQGL